MKVKFNHFERVAGLFVLSAVLGCFAILVGVAIKQGWFESKVRYETTLSNADGVHVGTLVQLAGLRAGSVTEVDLRSNNVVHVQFEISEKYQSLVRQNSVVRMIRPFIISEKVFDVSVGDSELPVLAAGQELKSEATADIMDFVSGRSLAPYFESMSKIVGNLRFVAESILDPERSRDMVRVFDELKPLVLNMNAMARQVSEVMRDSNKNQNLVKLLASLRMTTTEVNKLLPEMNKMMPELASVVPKLAKDSPKLAADMAKIAGNLAALTDELSSTLPTIKQMLVEIGPEVPRASRRAMEALDETVVTLKALQRSFLLRGNARDVRDEEAERERSRWPASRLENPAEKTDKSDGKKAEKPSGKDEK